ncbi:unnamed protein product [Urochloa decumbens]|uniref:AAA+ ATPase domain-containing protein n=1 Tax=Urochloa decumbens TaxID=240449 RepID=A0ABC8W9Q6_9POAL
MATAMVSTAFSVLGKALAPLTDDLLKDWAASMKLGDNVRALELELLSAKAILEPAVGREIDNASLKELLEQLQELGYDAEDVLDELDYFRIHDELNGTSEAADKHPKGFVHNLALNAKAVGKHIIGLPTCLSSDATPGAKAANRQQVNGGKAKLTSTSCINTVGKHFPCSSLPSVREDDDSSRMSNSPQRIQHTNDDEPPKLRFSRVEASTRMQLIVGQLRLVRENVSDIIKTLGSSWSTVPNIAQSRTITTSESIEPKLYGRGRIMNGIIHDITTGKHSGEVLTVIPIVGVGGIGKTTLAQHIYHSKQVQEHFEVKVWKCVSLNFDANKLIGEIEKYIPKVDGESSTGTAEELIGQRLKNKRFLLVFDDIWDCSDDDEWERLLLPFKKSQAHGNIIIVTTRLTTQAQIMVRNIDHPITLQGLEHTEFLEFFLAIVFGNDQSRKADTFFIQTGDAIARLLKGSPLAAKTVGRLLKAQPDDRDRWTRVLKSKEWEKSKGKNDIMPALQLSYHYLPLHLKQCFSYCGLFPQDYEFQQEELINFWIGLDVLHSSGGENKRIEDIGFSHLTELVNHGFFEEVQGKKGSACYILHDLLHELARKVSSHECLSIDNSQSQVSSLQVLPSVRHLSINIDNTGAKDRSALKNCVDDFKTLDKKLKVEKLRTLMLFGEHHGCLVKVFGDLFREAKALRAVYLSETSCDVEDLLQNFYSFVHLRYLWIRSSDCPWFFPNRRLFRKKLSRFYHMMVLDAKKYNIIPRDMSNLEKLRHFHVQDGSRVAEVGKLKSLQELAKFVVKVKDQGFELKQIGNLAELCGSLSISNLEKVQVVEEADEAKLMDKSRLHELSLSWTSKKSTNNDSALEELVLERLEPSSNLQNLSISGNRGDTCPSWIGTNLSLKYLESLCLRGVAWKTFPPIGELWLVNVSGEEISSRMPEKRFENLRRLELVQLPLLKRWVVHAPCQLFPSLEVIVISHCSNLVELSFSHSACCQQEELGNVFRKLSSFNIESCPNLSSFPILLPWTNEATCSIHIQDTGSSSLDSLVCEKDNSHAEYRLAIKGNGTPDSKFWNLLAFDNLTKLKELDMYGCQPPPLHHLQKLSSLRTLSMSCPSNAFPFVEADSHVEYQFPVENLVISQWSASRKDLTQLLSYFPKLSNLSLTTGEKITGLGVMEQQATAAPEPSSSSANKLDEQRQQQDARTEERLVALEAADGLLLLPPQLQELFIYRCPELSLRCSNPLDDNKEDGGTIGGGGLQGLSSLRDLWIKDCPKILSSYCSSSSHSSCFPFPNSLEDLGLEDMEGMETTLLPLSNLSSLTSLSISDCGDLRGDGLLSLLAQGNLTRLSVSATPNFFLDSDPSRVHEPELPPRSSKLQHLWIDDVAGFTATPICSLLFSSLTSLGIRGVVERFTEEQEDLLFVNSLEEIIFYSCDNLQYLPARIHRLPNLKRLKIENCKAIQMLPKDGLPSSLQELEIVNCPEIRSLPKDGLPSSLQKLKIRKCPAIRSLPKVDNLPNSMRELDIERCGNEELETQCRKLIGIIPIVKASY